MKIKADFVTNSSSASFVVMGAYIDGSLIREELLQTIRDDCNDQNLTIEEVRQYPLEYIEGLFKPFKDFDFSSGEPYSDGTPMIGIPYDRMDNDETLRQFKQRVMDGIKDALGIDVEVGHIEQCWIDN